METQMNTAIIFINLAALFYTIGVFAEKFQSELKLWHVGIFWCGFICDSIGTHAMGLIVGNGFQINFHSITGATALVLMLFHAGWASWVILKKDVSMKKKFHRCSIVVWAIWLIPMLSGMVLKIIS